MCSFIHSNKLEEGRRMGEERLSRRGFLASAGKLAAGATAGAIGLSMAIGSQAEAAETPAWPWPYKRIDPNAVDKRGEELYWKVSCSQGVFQAVCEALGHPFTTIPYGMVKWGEGGGVGWGSHCGALVGGNTAIGLVHQDSKVYQPLIKELTGWYTEFIGHGSPLCHVSVTEWAKENGVQVESQARKERCGRVTGVVARKVAELLNAQDEQAFATLFGPRWSVVTCLSCHGTAGMSDVRNGVLMDCAPCHGDPHK
jgi:hypothetical protein